MEGVGDPWKVHVFNTYFLSKLQDQGYEKAKLNKWTKKVRVLQSFPGRILLIEVTGGHIQQRPNTYPM